METKNILVIRLSAMGDVAMSVPVAAQLAQRADVRVTVLTRRAFLPLFAELQNVSCWAFEEERHGNILGLFYLFCELWKRKKWYVVIDLHDVLRTKFLRFLFRFSGVKIAVFRKNYCKKRKLTRKHCKKLVQLPLVQNEYANACKRAGFPIEIKSGNLYDNGKLPAELIKVVGEKNEKWFGIAPLAKHLAKIYPFEKMQEIIRYFSEKGGVKIFLFGGKNDAEILERATIYNNVYSLAGKTSLAGELQIMAHLDCVLSMDSGNMHLANLVNVPVISVWGATHPYAGFASVGNVKNIVVQRNLDCRPCSVFGNKPCWKGTYECMDITPEQIINTIESIL